MKHAAYVALGSNIAPEANLPAAVSALRQQGEIAGVSHVYESAPVGNINQPRFLNAAVLLMTDHSAETLCREVLPTIEHDLLRVRDPHNKNGPRTIDLDLVLFDQESMTIDHRHIPDPDILTRIFLAVPLAEIAPHDFHPIDGRTLKEIAASLSHENADLQSRPDVGLSS